MQTSYTPEDLETYDVVIAGTGYVGLTLALSLKWLEPNLSLFVFDSAIYPLSTKDERASALTQPTVNMLKNLGCWDKIIPYAQPVFEMLITDSSLESPIRPVFLRFDSGVSSKEPFSYIVPNFVLQSELVRLAKQKGIRIESQKILCKFEPDFNNAVLQFSDNSKIKTRLLIAADGAQSQLRTIAGIKTINFNYKQSGIICTVRHERPHKGKAIQHFLPSGSFAILPLKENRSSVVWTEKKEKAEKIKALNASYFKEELMIRFGAQYGEVFVESEPQFWDIRSILPYNFVKSRFALVGDSAHGVHPLAGQGLNLGFKDSAALAETIAQAYQLGQDLGSISILQNYERIRRPDAVQMVFLTDTLNRLFSNDNTMLRGLRNLGLSITDRSVSLKKYLFNQAMWGIGKSQGSILLGCLEHKEKIKAPN